MPAPISSSKKYALFIPLQIILKTYASSSLAAKDSGPLKDDLLRVQHIFSNVIPDCI